MNHCREQSDSIAAWRRRPASSLPAREAWLRWAAAGLRWGIGLVLAAALPRAGIAATAVVDLAVTHQVIRGFGGTDAWLPGLDDPQMDLLFGNDEPGQIGLTIYRMRIAPDGAWDTEISNAQKAAARGAIVFATPWSPPAVMKTNGNVIGGSLKADAYGAYAQYLQDFAVHVASQGVPLYAISIQNEPDWDPDYEGCVWTAANFLTFCRDQAGRITETRLIMPESLYFNQALSNPTLNDPVAAANVDIVGGHIYGGGLVRYALALSKGKEIWMTEHLELTTDWAGALATAREIHDCLATADHSAYLWWYLKRFYGPLDDSNVVTKRGYVMAQFAKFIRPGSVRVEATANPGSGVYVSAYKGGRTVIVAINTGAADVTQSFTLQNGAAAAFTPWTTSGSVSLAVQPAIPVANATFNATLPAGSVTTFVESRVGDGPALTRQPENQAVAPGAAARVSVAATVPAGQATPQFAWQRNGRAIGNAPAAVLNLANFQPGDAGLYRALVSSGERISESNAAVLGIATPEKIVGAGREVATDVRHANGNVYDQVLLTGAAGAITADAGQVTRTSFIDIDDDIVQVEFSGPGTLSIVLDSPTGPALPIRYNQEVAYMKGHAGIVITGATEQTNVSVFSVGRATATNPGLFKDNVTYDGIADIAFIAIASSNGKFGGVRAANAVCFASRGLTGLHAPRVAFLGPVYLGNILAFDDARPVLQIGTASDVRITGGDLAQPNGVAVGISGVTRLKFTAGTDSHGNLLPARANRGVLVREGRDVTAEVVVTP